MAQIFAKRTLAGSPEAPMSSRRVAGDTTGLSQKCPSALASDLRSTRGFDGQSSASAQAARPFPADLCHLADILRQLWFKRFAPHAASV